MLATALAPILALGLSSVAAASDWMSVGTLYDGSVQVAIDKATIVYGPVTRAWVKFTYQKSQGLFAAGDVGLNLYDYKCASRESRLIEMILQSKTTGTSSQKVNGAWEPAAPDSADEAILQVLCVLKPTPDKL
jgi:hypothetical protein